MCQGDRIWTPHIPFWQHGTVPRVVGVANWSVSRSGHFNRKRTYKRCLLVRGSMYVRMVLINIWFVAKRSIFCMLLTRRLIEDLDILKYVSITENGTPNFKEQLEFWVYQVICCSSRVGLDSAWILYRFYSVLVRFSRISRWHNKRNSKHKNTSNRFQPCYWSINFSLPECNLQWITVL